MTRSPACARDGVDHPRYLLRLVELELIDRERRVAERRIRQARFPAVKSLDAFDFTAIPSLNKTLVLELARCEFIRRRENAIALGNSGAGKSHVALALGLAACQKGFPAAFTTAAALVHKLMEARDEMRLLTRTRGAFGAVRALRMTVSGEVNVLSRSTSPHPVGACQSSSARNDRQFWRWRQRWTRSTESGHAAGFGCHYAAPPMRAGKATGRVRVEQAVMHMLSLISASALEPRARLAFQAAPARAVEGAEGPR
jgi:hypothetical protein